MKIICDKALLTEAVANVSRAVSAKNTVAALEGILIKAYGGSVQLTGYDLDLAITTSITADVIKEGELVLTAKILLDMIRRMPHNSVTIDCDEKLLTQVQGGSTEYTILGIPAQEFPELPSVTQGDSVSVEKTTLKNMIDQTLFAAATTDSKPAHMGARFDIEETSMNVVAVDGFRLALRHEPLKASGAYHFTVPSKSLQEVSKLIKEDEGKIEMQISRRHISFQIGEYCMVSRLIEGEFLDYKAAIPNAGKTMVRISAKELVSSIERTSLLISDAVKSPLRMRFAGNAVELSCATSLGKAHDEITCEMQGEEVEIGFNSRYLLDALKASGCDVLRIELNGPFSPVKILPLEGEDFVFLVLPVRLKVE